MPWGPAVGACASRAPGLGPADGAHRTDPGSRSAPPPRPAGDVSPAAPRPRRSARMRVTCGRHLPVPGSQRQSEPARAAAAITASAKSSARCPRHVSRPPARPPLATRGVLPRAGRHPPRRGPGGDTGGGGSRPRLPCRRPGLLLPVTALGRLEPVPGGLARAMAPGAGGREDPASARPPRPSHHGCQSSRVDPGQRLGGRFHFNRRGN